MTSAPPSISPRFGKCLNLLCLDGGGVRGLSSLYILQRLMEELARTDTPNQGDHEARKDLPKPCDVFDFIGGTSTGGLIAIMLGRLRLTVAECIEAYIELMPTLFEKTRHRFSLKTRKLQGRFDGEVFAESVKRLLRKQGLPADAALKDTESQCKTFVCATRKTGRQTTVFSSYEPRRRGREFYDTLKIWEAARATSAATTFFDSIEILGEEFADGAFGANNPLNEMWTEAGDTIGDNDGHLEDNIGCLVSIGTGQAAFEVMDDNPVSIVQTLKNIALDCDNVVENFERQHKHMNGRFFRFNVQHGLENVGLEDAHKRSDIAGATRRHLELNANFRKLQQCCLALKHRQWLHRVEQYVWDMNQHGHSHTYNASSRVTTMSHVDYSWITNTDAFNGWLTSGNQANLLIDWSAMPAEQGSSSTISALAASIMKRSEHQKLRLVTLDLSYHLGLDRRHELPCHEDNFGNIIEQSEAEKKRRRTYSIRCVQVLVTLACLVFASDKTKTLTDHIMSFPPSVQSLLDAVASFGAIDWPIETASDEELAHLSESSVKLLFGQSCCRASPATPLVICFHNIDVYGYEASHYLLKTYRNLVNANIVCLNTSQALRPEHKKMFRLMCSIVQPDTEYQECISSLATTRAFSRFDQVEHPSMGTFDWLPTHASFDHWIREGGVLWIRGKPGSGKSTIAKHAITNLDLYQTDDVVIGSWFYSVQLDDLHRSHDVGLRTLLHCFLRHDKKIFEDSSHVYRNMRTSTQTMRSLIWSRQYVEQFLRSIATSPSSPILVGVIDALDESEDSGDEDRSRDRLLELLMDLAQRSHSRLRLIILSRPYKSFQLRFRDCEQIVLDQETHNDIERVVDEGLYWLRKTLSSSPMKCDEDQQLLSGLRRTRLVSRGYGRDRKENSFTAFIQEEFQAMRTYLLANAKGVFLWIKLVLRELHRMAKTSLPDVRDLRKTLNALPLELGDLYVRIVERLVETKDLAKTKRILTWTIGTPDSHPLTLLMLADALSIGKSDNVKDYLRATSDPFLPLKPLSVNFGAFALDVYDQCGGLISISPPSAVAGDYDRQLPADHSLETNANHDWIVILLHRTTVDFFSTSRCPHTLQLHELNARTQVKSDLMTYLQVYLPHSSCVGSFHPRSVAGPKSSEFVGCASGKVLMMSNERRKGCQDWGPSDTERLCWSPYAGQFFAPIASDLLDYLEDLELLGYALEVLPEMWDVLDATHLREYKRLVTQEPKSSDPAWSSWLYNVPTSLWTQACENDCRNTMRIFAALNKLQAIHGHSTSRSGLGSLGAYMMLRSVTPSFDQAIVVPKATNAYLDELERHACQAHATRLIREIGQACAKHETPALANYITWVWSNYYGAGISTFLLNASNDPHGEGTHVDPGLYHERLLFITGFLQASSTYDVYGSLSSSTFRTPCFQTLASIAEPLVVGRSETESTPGQRQMCRALHSVELLSDCPPTSLSLYSTSDEQSGLKQFFEARREHNRRVVWDCLPSSPSDESLPISLNASVPEVSNRFTEYHQIYSETEMDDPVNTISATQNNRQPVGKKYSKMQGTMPWSTTVVYKGSEEDGDSSGTSSLEPITLASSPSKRAAEIAYNLLGLTVA